MNIKHAGILAGALLSSNALALDPNDPNLPTPVEIWVSGASAQDNFIETLFPQICRAGTLDIMRDISNPARPGRAHRAFYCTVDNTLVDGLNADVNVVFHKRSAGGSAQGVNPVVDGQAIDAMSIFNNNCTNVGGNEWHCTVNNVGDIVQQISTAGVSDVNPEMFVGVNTPAGSSPVDAQKVATTMDVTPAAALVFGVPATTSLRNALQAAQINEGKLAGGCINDESEACMPSLSRHQVSALMSGQVTDWDKFKVSDGAGGLVGLTSMASASATIKAPTINHVVYCRRVNGSGTQAQMNAKFLNNPCTPGALPPLVTSTFSTGPEVYLNSGSGDVDLCLNDFENQTNDSGHNVFNDILWAFGVQSTEKNADRADDWRFVKIDGVAPTIENAANGSYSDVVELTYQWKKQGEPNAPTAVQLAILNHVATNAGGPDIMGPINVADYSHGFGIGGYLALTVNNHKVGANGVFNVNLPVTPYTHSPAGNALDNCRIPVLDRNAEDVNGNPAFPL